MPTCNQSAYTIKPDLQSDATLSQSGTVHAVSEPAHLQVLSAQTYRPSDFDASITIILIILFMLACSFLPASEESD